MKTKIKLNTIANTVLGVFTRCLHYCLIKMFDISYSWAGHDDGRWITDAEKDDEKEMAPLDIMQSSHGNKDEEKKLQQVGV